MKITDEKLFDEMLKDNMQPSETKEQLLEKQINENIKASMEKMQQSFTEKLEKAEERINNLMKEKENNNEEIRTEEGQRTGADKDLDLSTEEAGGQSEGEC